MISHPMGSERDNGTSNREEKCNRESGKRLNRALLAGGGNYLPFIYAINICFYSLMYFKG